MKLFVAVFALTLAACAHAPSLSAGGPAQTQAFDPVFAERVGADERGMRPYVLAILTTGPNTTLSSEERQRLFHAHMANIQSLAEQGALVIAGPLGPNDRQYRGIFILNVATVEEAAALIATDPAVAAGVFAYEAYPWYATAALMEVPVLDQRLRR